ncbi:putative 2-phosphoglycerate kinase [Monocercomonoides exilis]|uniref:putative 2-phosphoglycerate kinase n=1 Tax=Monocercomonoides exilis TaxID=2049356 RepID=UPI0035596AC9|nr:putative 2-phosphoglycerate kinase [Monocercomonoides exilis]|eukprot:MONOS_7285.1-p1 / transcript=MONOS_7285.1 / gene=MONOS_7285 / organism=Monocercomonoides_exilis_PA203 / gene_product=Unknown protein / transcript_product=Unknown protein / location=Mono_scaffold00246:20188-22626(-) / protein_length=790 / sequence_SO=supercontig / SO=protein_coding / is_pseudo=false
MSSKKAVVSSHFGPGSKYDYVKVKIRISGGHTTVFSRFLISRFLRAIKIPERDSQKISLELKKLLVDEGLLEISQGQLDAFLLCLMVQYGYGKEYFTRYRMISSFFRERVPLVIIISGTGCLAKKAVATTLANQLNLPNVLHASLVSQILTQVGKIQASYSGSKIWFSSFRDVATHPPLDLPPLFATMQKSLTQEDRIFLSYFQSQCKDVRNGVAFDVKKAKQEGKAVIVEGSFLDPRDFADEMNYIQQIKFLTNEAQLTNENKFGENAEKDRKEIIQTENESNEELQQKSISSKNCTQQSSLPSPSLHSSPSKAIDVGTSSNVNNTLTSPITHSSQQSDKGTHFQNDFKASLSSPSPSPMLPGPSQQPPAVTPPIVSGISISRDLSLSATDSTPTQEPFSSSPPKLHESNSDVAKPLSDLPPLLSPSSDDRPPPDSFAQAANTTSPQTEAPSFPSAPSPSKCPETSSFPTVGCVLFYFLLTSPESIASPTIAPLQTHTISNAMDATKYPPSFLYWLSSHRLLLEKRQKEIMQMENPDEELSPVLASPTDASVSSNADRQQQRDKPGKEEEKSEEASSTQAEQSGSTSYSATGTPPIQSLLSVPSSPAASIVNSRIAALIQHRISLVEHFLISSMLSLTPPASYASLSPHEPTVVFSSGLSQQTFRKFAKIPLHFIEQPALQQKKIATSLSPPSTPAVKSSSTDPSPAMAPSRSLTSLSASSPAPTPNRQICSALIHVPVRATLDETVDQLHSIILTVLHSLYDQQAYDHLSILTEQDSQEHTQKREAAK